MDFLASSISEPGQAAPQILESLRNAGVKDLPSKAKDEGHSAQNSGKTQQALPNKGSKADTAEINPNTARTESSHSSETKAGEVRKPRNTRKSVSFTADTKTESLLEHKSKTKIPIIKPVDPVIPKDEPTEDETLRLKPVIAVDEPLRAEALPQQSIISENEPPKEETLRRQPVIPANESAEDAALRRQMIQYSMSEVNNIVAEMNLDDEASNASYSDAGSEEVPDDSSLDEDEDKFGRTKRRVLSDDYLAEMRALEQKLNAKAIQNVGPNAPLEASTLASDHEIEEQTPMQSKSNSATNPPATKAVRFAEELDIQSPPSQPALPPAPTQTPQPPPKPKPTHSNTIIERPYTTTSTHPPEPDEYDPALLQQQVRTEYHELRNRMIQRQGGFTDPGDRAEVPLSEAEGGPKKMSRFKAARLGTGGLLKGMGHCS